MTTATDGPVANESYVVKQVQTKVASCLTAYMHDVGAHVGWLPGAWRDTRLVDASTWRKGNMVVATQPWNHHHTEHNEYLHFKDAAYGPDSKIVYGTPQLLQNVEDRDQAKSKIFRNKSEDEIHVGYSESEELQDSVGHTVSNSMHMDITSEQTVSGSYAGVSAEAKFTEAFGVAFDDSTTKEQSQTESEAVAIDFTIKPGEFILVEVLKEHERTRTEFSIDGYLDFTIWVKLNHWREDRGHNHFLSLHNDGFTLPSVNGIEQFFRGYDTDHPEMEGYWKAANTRVRNGVNWILEPTNRRVQVEGVKDRVLEQNADFDITELGSAIPEDLAHLPVVDSDSLAKAA